MPNSAVPFGTLGCRYAFAALKRRVIIEKVPPELTLPFKTSFLRG